MSAAIELQNVKKTYQGGVEALKGVSLSIAEGDFFALLGPNGAGKTTLIGIISSLVTKTSGKATIFGHDIDAMHQKQKPILAWCRRSLISIFLRR
jgi:ABC-2 type transport system ATP-binding protein